MFEEKTLREAIATAERAAGLVSDPNLRQAAFEITLRAALDGSSSAGNRAKPSPRQREKPEPSDVEATGSVAEGLERLADDCQLSMEQIQNVIRVHDGEAQLFRMGEYANAAEQHVDLACVLLTIKDYLTGSREEKCTVLRRTLAKMGVSDVSHVSHHIKLQPQRIRTVGKGKSMVYSLTVPTGRNHGISVIRRLAAV